MLRAVKFHALNFEVATNEGKKIDPGDDDVATQRACRFLSDAKVRAKPLENLRGKKCDLAFVIFSMIEVAVSEQAFAREALDSVLLNRRGRSRWLAVVADKIVFGRNEDLFDLHVGRTAKTCA